MRVLLITDKSVSPIPREALDWFMPGMHTKHSVGHYRACGSDSMVNPLFQESVSYSLPIPDNCAVHSLSGSVYSFNVEVSGWMA